MKAVGSKFYQLYILQFLCRNLKKQNPSANFLALVYYIKVYSETVGKGCGSKCLWCNDLWTTIDNWWICYSAI